MTVNLHCECPNRMHISMLYGLLETWSCNRRMKKFVHNCLVPCYRHASNLQLCKEMHFDAGWYRSSCNCSHHDCILYASVTVVLNFTQHSVHMIAMLSVQLKIVELYVLVNICVQLCFTLRLGCTVQCTSTMTVCLVYYADIPSFSSKLKLLLGLMDWEQLRTALCILFFLYHCSFVHQCERIKIIR